MNIFCDINLQENFNHKFKKICSQIGLNKHQLLGIIYLSLLNI